MDKNRLLELIGQRFHKPTIFGDISSLLIKCFIEEEVDYMFINFILYSKVI